MSNYLIDLKIDGDDLKYLRNLIKFISSSHCTRMQMMLFNKIIDKNMLKNEYYIIAHYIDFFCRVKSLSRVDLDAIKRLVHIDREMFVGNPNINLGEVISVAKDDQGALIEQITITTLEEINEIVVDENTFEESYGVLQEIVVNLEVQNLMYASSLIFFEGKKIGKKEFKGREGYIEFLTSGLMKIKNKKSKGGENIQKVDKEYLLVNASSSEELFPHPLDTVQSSWGNVKGGDSISILAPMNVGKTTIALNYGAQSLISKHNTALFISEMSKDAVVARLVSIIGARKYGIKIPTGKVNRYFKIDAKIAKNEALNELDKRFIKENELYINNVEYILNALVMESNQELGTLHCIEDLSLKDVDMTFELLAKDKDVRFIVVDHVNGVQAGYGMSDAERINEAYVQINKLGKRYGVANAISNHIPDEFLSILSDPQKDKSTVRGFGGGQSTKSPDYVLLLDASTEQKKRGEMTVMTNKDRNSNTFFDPIPVGIQIEVGSIFEVELE